MRTSKNVRVRRGEEESSISLPCYALSKRASLLLLMDMMQISYRSKKDKTEGKKQGNRGEQGDEQSCREGKYMNKRCVLCHQSSTLLHTVIKQKPFHLE